MGLDMYLNARSYMSRYNEDEKTKAETINTLFNLTADDDYTAQEVVFRVAYWRKTNSVHNWFVKNVQGDKDDCSPYYVSKENLELLKETCEKVLEDKSLAPSLLPTQSGFFFGGTEYDEWYFKDLKYTVERLNKILADPVLERMSFEYQSSW